VNARYRIAGEPAGLVHKSIVELHSVREGSGTLVTGGNTVDRKIQGGIERVVKAGDLVFVPHGFTTGISSLNVHFEGTD
jgi:mannose-6-phosphate isomerase-like protein (cupin superfamily)